jgi:gp16 family phage-associated protein
MIRSPKEVKEDFKRKGLSVTKWAVKNGFSPQLTYLVLAGKRTPTRGQTHDIAVRLGIKEGEIVKDHELATAVNA